MAGNEIAQAWVTLIPSFKGGQGAIAKELGAVGSEGGQKASKGFVSGFGGAVKGIGKVALGAGGVVAGVLAGIAGTGGFNRAMAIEQAQSKLSGLGHDTKNVEKIMDNASAAVKGTAFGLGDAATVAASVVAAGIKPGEDLTRTLTLVGDAATIAGTDMSSMGAIFGKVAASNKVQMDVINQLHDAGVPALQLLADELGVTAEEASKMASSGKIDFATFQAAMEEGMGGAALKSGETFKGAMANAKAALGRIGETFLSPFLSALTVGFGAVIPIFDGINAALKPVMASVGAWLDNAIPRMAQGIQGLYDLVVKGDFTSAFSEAFRVEEDGLFVGLVLGFRDAIVGIREQAELFKGDLYGMFAAGDLASVISEAFWLPPDSGMHQMLVTAQSTVAGIIESFMELPAFLSTIGQAFMTGLTPGLDQVGLSFGDLIGLGMELWTSLSPVQLIFQALAPLLPQIAGLVGQVVGVVAQLLAAVVPLAAQLAAALIPALTQIALAVLPALGQIIGVVAEILPTLIPLFTMIAQAVVGVVTAVAPLVAQLVSALVPIFTQLAATVIPVVIQAIAAIIPPVLMVVNVLVATLVPIIQSLLPIITTVFQAIASIISGVMQVISGVIQVVMGVISGNWSAVWSGIQAVLAGVWNIIVGVVQGAVALVQGVIVGALGIIRGLWDAAWSWISQFLANTWNSMVDAVSAGVDKVGGFFRDLPGKIGGFLAGLPGQLLGIGRDMIQGLINGIGNMAGAVKGVIGDVIGGGINAAKAALGINSPSRVFMEIGEYTGEGLAVGITSQSRAVQRATDALLPSASAPDYVPASWSAGAGAPGTQGHGDNLVDELVEALSRVSVQMDGRTTVGALARTNRR